MPDFASTTTSLERQEINTEAYLKAADDIVADPSIPNDRAAMISDRADLVVYKGVGRAERAIFVESRAHRLATQTRDQELKRYELDMQVYQQELAVYQILLDDWIKTGKKGKAPTPPVKPVR